MGVGRVRKTNDGRSPSSTVVVAAALAAERVDPALVDVDEVDRVAGGGEALAGRASHDTGADDDDI